MKKLLLLIPLCLSLVGCAGNKPMTKAVYTLAVSTGVSVGAQRYPTAVPYARIANTIICASATGTNVSPAEILTAIQTSPIAEAAATPEGKLVVNGVLVLYSALFEGGGVTDEEAKEWLQWTCDAVTLGLPPAGVNTVPVMVLSPKTSAVPYLK